MDNVPPWSFPSLQTVAVAVVPVCRVVEHHTVVDNTPLVETLDYHHPLAEEAVVAPHVVVVPPHIPVEGRIHTKKLEVEVGRMQMSLVAFAVPIDYARNEVVLVGAAGHRVLEDKVVLKGDIQTVMGAFLKREAPD